MLTVPVLKTEPRISAVIPVYNGSQLLENCVGEIRRELSNTGCEWEILIAEDGSTDGTPEVCQRLRKWYPELRFMHEDSRLGRGESLRRALQAARGDILLYADVDMSTDPQHFAELIDTVENGADIVVGSRYLPESAARRSFLRLAMSLAYNRLVRLLLGSKLRDHQCGFKAFKRQPAYALLPEVKSPHWFWDTEMLVRAQWKGLRVVEIPVKWTEAETKSTVSLARDTIRFLREVLRLRRDLYSRRN